MLLADAYAVVRVGYRTLLAATPDLILVAEADDGEAAVKAFLAHRPAVAIMDLGLPGTGGLEAIRRIVQRSPEAQILAFGAHEDPIFVQQALRAGARGYVTKHSTPAVLVDAVRQVAAGGVYLNALVAQRLALQKVRGASSPLAELSTREFEIFCLLAGGEKILQVARRLSLSAKTVGNYATSIKSKLAVHSLTELTRLAIRLGLSQA
ncbi:MAG: response regulator transcription factor [Gammaproteobacteria bacterium]|nr:response regulator transcription factor [Gammaproteobacteria bacterium]